MKSIDSRLLIPGLLLMVLGSAHSVFGHHSLAMYDTQKSVVMKATVKTFQWTNPHVLLFFVTIPPAGQQAEEWSGELTSPGNLTRAGWTKRSLNPGDTVTVEVSPLKSGGHSGAVRKVTTADGKVLTFSFAELEKPGLK